MGAGTLHICFALLNKILNNLNLVANAWSPTQQLLKTKACCKAVAFPDNITRCFGVWQSKVGCVGMPSMIVFHLRALTCFLHLLFACSAASAIARFAFPHMPDTGFADSGGQSPVAIPSLKTSSASCEIVSKSLHYNTHSFVVLGSSGCEVCGCEASRRRRWCWIGPVLSTLR